LEAVVLVALETLMVVMVETQRLALLLPLLAEAMAHKAVLVGIMLAVMAVLVAARAVKQGLAL
jgi:hypothetical protein